MMQDTGYKIQDSGCRITVKKTIMHHALWFMHRVSCIVHHDRRGVTLVELIIVIAIIGIIVLFATIDTAWFQKDARVTEARDRLLADIEDAKLKSLAQVPHAIQLTGATSYKMVKLNDANSNFKWDSGEATPDIANSSVTLATNLKISGPAGNLLWFDRRGIPKSSTWGVGNTTFTIWYDADGGGDVDSDERSKTITISQDGRIQYE